MATRPKKPRTSDSGLPPDDDDGVKSMSYEPAEPGSPKTKSDGSSSFLRAARAGNLDKVIELLKTGKADVNSCNSNGLNALHLSAKEGHIDIVHELLGRGIDVDSATKKGNTALHIASLAGQLEVVKLLLQYGARINNQSQNGFTPLYMAAQENHVSVVRFLLDKGANATLSTADGFTPMAVALQQGHSEVVNSLMEYSQKGRVRLSALHVAAKKDDVRAAALLLQNDQNAVQGSKNQAGGLVNETTKSDFTPLHIAAHYGNANITALLIEKGANVNFKAKNGITPLHVASKWGRKDIAVLLLDNNANIECRTRDGLTPLHCAARSGHDLVVDLLLEYNAPVTTKTRNGLTALHMAAQGDHVECARILIFHKAPVDEVTVDYLTPLHVAAHCGNVAVAKLLLDRKCQVDARALNGFTPLHIACKKNRIKVIELLLQYGAQLNSTTESGLTPLHVASFMGHIDIVSFLLHRGCDPNAVTVRGETALHLATRGNQTAVIKQLLRNGAQVDAKAKEQQTALHIASRLGFVNCVLVLLENGASPNAATAELYTPLHIAAKEGHEEVAQVLLDRGATPSLATAKGFTALHITAKYGCVRVANILLKKNANANIEGKNGLTPLHVAAHYNHPAMVKLLLDHKASPHSTARNGYTALHIAAKKDELEIAAMLLEYGAKPNAESKNGFTALHLATQEGHSDMVSLLLERKAQVNGKAKNGLTAMHLAAQEDHVPVAEILVKYNSLIDHQTKAGYTPLHTACHFGQLNMIRFLLDHGASVSAVTKQGYTPLHQAAQQGHVLVINILLKYKTDPNALTTTGQTPLSIAQQLGYISVVEILKQVTQVVVETPAIDHYRMLSPEIMQEVAMSDEEDEGEDVNLADQSYPYLRAGDDMRGLQDDSSHAKDQDLFAFDMTSGRRSVGSSVGGRDRIQDDLRYTTEIGEMSIESSTAVIAMRELQYSSLERGDEKRKPLSPPADGLSSPGYLTDDMDVDAAIHGRAWDDHLKQHEGIDGASEVFADGNEMRLSSGPNKQLQLKARPPSLDVYVPKENGVDIVITAEDAAEQQHMAYMPASSPHTETLPTPTDLRGYRSNMSESDSRRFGSSSAMSYASSFDPDNVALRHPVYSGFLVSFLVDARGGAMRGCRHSGIRIIIPPLKLCQPTRITCKLLRRDKLSNPPPLMEGEALASRVLVMGPSGAKFNGPVILEVPHFASLRGGEREIMVLRSDNGQTWREHPEIASEQTIQSALCGSFEDLETAEELYQRRITRIITADFPKYFAIVTRIHQDSSVVGPEGGIMKSTIVPQVKADFPPGAFTKSIRVGLQAHSVSPELVSKTLGSSSSVFVSPVVTIEPRRRKFHSPITVTLPLPREMQIGKQPIKPTENLRLLCSITGGTDTTEWEDITGSTPVSLLNNCVSFTTSVSARFWLVYCTTPLDAVQLATRLYAEAIVVPFMANFVIFAKRRSETEAQLRMFCMTDDKIDKTLECQENFREIARSRDIEVLDGKPQYIEMEGNLVVVQKPPDPTKPESIDGKEKEKQLYISFRAFRENRRHVNVRVWDPTQEAVGTAVFLAEPPLIRRNQVPLCNLTVNLGDADEGRYADAASNVSADTADLCRKLEALHKMEFPEEEQISKAQLRLTDIAEYLEGDWVILAKHLGITGDEIKKIQSEYGYVVEQALVMLHLWVEKNRNEATGNALERALKAIRREDIINRCIRTMEEVTDVSEKRAAKAQIEALDNVPITKPPPPPKPAHLTRSPAGKRDSADDKIVPEVDLRRPIASSDSKKPAGIDDVALTALANHLNSVDDAGLEDAPIIADRADVQESFPENEFNLITPPSTPTLPADAPLSPSVTEEEIVASIKRKSLTDMSLDSLEQPTVFKKPSRQEPQPDQQTPSFAKQTFEEWASQSSLDTASTGASSVATPIPPPVSVPVTNQPAEYLETAFEDWVEQKELSQNESVAAVEPIATESAAGGDDDNGFEDVKHVFVEGDVEIRAEVDDTEESLDDGTTITRQVITRRRICPISEVYIVNGIETKCQTTDKVLDVEIEEEVLCMPPGVTSIDTSDDFQAMTDVQETEYYTPDGIPCKHKVVTTTVVFKPTDVSEELDDSMVDLKQQAQEIVNQSVQSALQEVCTVAPPEESAPNGLTDEDDPDQDLATLRVYTDTIEHEPEFETDVQETEETLPDGTVIRRRVTKTKQKQTIVKRIVMEGPEDELPTTEEQVQQLLQQTELDSSIDKDILERYGGDRSVTEIIDEPETKVQEFEETLEDGTVIQRKIVTTTQQQLTTERAVFEDDSGDEHFVESSYEEDVPQPLDPSTGDASVSCAADEENGECSEESDDEGATRLVLKKEIRTQRVLRNGKEETIITEDVHVVQEDEPPPELDNAMQNVIDQFMGRSHSGQSSV